ncbi:MAG: hypothetical protein A4E53_01562 [Pelotomaculum sp. PtaB.Bin104]|nr:MAG: hypothetical protein A4E53_01562 [Pelotomaculum sp. PtaB.Bin104]
MTTEELRNAIESTKARIYELKRQIKATNDPGEKNRLERWLKEAQYLQLWHLDQADWK